MGPQPRIIMHDSVCSVPSPWASLLRKSMSARNLTMQDAASRLLVFRPFNGEVLVGTVHNSTPQGLWISVGFFQDIHVPSHLLPEGSEWDQEVRFHPVKGLAQRSARVNVAPARSSPHLLL